MAEVIRTNSWVSGIRTVLEGHPVPAGYKVVVGMNVPREPTTEDLVVEEWEITGGGSQWEFSKTRYTFEVMQEFGCVAKAREFADGLAPSPDYYHGWYHPRILEVTGWEVTTNKATWVGTFEPQRVPYRVPGSHCGVGGALDERQCEGCPDQRCRRLSIGK